MYAVFQFAGFQYSAEVGSVIRVPSLAEETGKNVSISEVLLVKDGDEARVGKPFVDGATVEAEVVASGLDDKVQVFKMKRRTTYRKTQGHRQGYTDLKITKINAGS